MVSIVLIFSNVFMLILLILTMVQNNRKTLHSRYREHQKVLEERVLLLSEALISDDTTIVEKFKEGDYGKICSKCFTKNRAPGDPEYKRGKNMKGSFCKSCSLVRREHLHRSCSSCGAEWLAECFDSIFN